MTENLLTIVVPTCFDFSGAMMTVVHLIMDRRFKELDYDILVVDNTPDESYRKKLLENLPMGSGRVSYIELPETRGPAHTKNTGIRAANGKFCLCIDCHVFLHDAALTKLYDFLENCSEEMSDNIFSGPLLYHGTYDGTVSTNFNSKWRGHMWGTWETNKSLLKDETPKEIEGQGCGLFLVKKESWLGFCDDYKGFAGEEMVIHEKYRFNGRKAMLLPWLGWWHRFGNPDMRQPINQTYFRIRNYILGFNEIGLDLKPIFDHFFKRDYKLSQLKRVLVEEHSFGKEQIKGVDEKGLRAMLETKKMPMTDWDRITSDPIGSDTLPTRKERIKTETPEKSTKKGMPSGNPNITDIVEALRYESMRDTPSAKELGFIASIISDSSAEKVAEITHLQETSLGLIVHPTVKEANSFYYFNMKPSKIFLDNERVRNGELKTQYQSGLDFETSVNQFFNSIDEVDVLLLKLPPLMEKENLAELLNLISERVKETLLIHDTINLPAEYEEALKEFTKNSKWKCKYIMSKVHNPQTKETFNTQGLASFSKDVDESDIQFPWKWVKFGAGTELKKMLSFLGFKVEKDCDCNKHARIMDELGIDWCERNVDLICDWLMIESEKKGWGASLPARIAAPSIILRSIKRHKKQLSKLKTANPKLER